MLLRDHYQGDNSPFRGDQTIVLGGLPAGAQITAATVVLTPSQTALTGAFEETFAFSPPAQLQRGDLVATDWGVSKNGQPGSLEVDFHNRYTLARVRGVTNLVNPTLQVDLGGVYVAINSHGAILAPGDTPYPITPGDSTLPGLTVSKFQLSRASRTASSSSAGPPVTTAARTFPAADLQAVSVRSVPSNISLRLGKLPPFWTLAGEIASARTSPDFTAALNAFLLAAVPQSGFYAIPFVLHSDTIARLDLDIELQYVIRQTALPPHLSQVSLPFDLSTQPGFGNGLTTVTLPRQARPVAGQTSAKIRGQFEPTRVALGPIGEEPATVPVQVSPRVTLAQAFTPPDDLVLLSIDLRLANTKPGISGLNVAIRDDEGGKPSQHVLAGAAVPVTKPLPGQSGWNTVTLPSPPHLLRGTPYWIVLQSLDQNAEWSATDGAAPGQPPLQASRDGGLSWRIAITPQTIVPLSALFRLRHRPVQFSIPVQLQIGSGKNAVRRTLQEYAPLGKIELAFDFAPQLSTYLKSLPPATACGSDDRIINGRFAQPPPDDATTRLFGDLPPTTGAAGGHLPEEIVGTVDLSGGADLSIERYLTLSFRKQPPTRVDCAGPDPGHTSLQDIITAINRATTAGTASTPDAKHLRLNSSRAILYFMWARSQAPDGWQGREGQVYRVGGPQLRGLTFAVLADPPLLAHSLEIDGLSIPVAPFLPIKAPVLRSAPIPADTSEPASLSQRLSVTPGCIYRLQASVQLTVDARAGRVPDPAVLPRWEVDWFDRNNVPIGSCAGPLPIRMAGQAAGPRVVEAAVTVPPGATAAELQFVNPLSDTIPLILEEVRFGPQAQLLDNSSLKAWTPGTAGTTPQGWTIISGLVVEALDPVTNVMIGATLRGDGPEDAVLAQTVLVTAGHGYTLDIQAQAASSTAVSPSEPTARVEIRWLSAGLVSDPIAVPLLPAALSRTGWAGDAPAGATAAELQVIQPRGGGNLTLQSISLTSLDLVPVPLLFLSEAPGQLTISNLDVAYDTLPPAVPLQPRVPPGQAATPYGTAPASVPQVATPPPSPAVPPPVTEPAAQVTPLSAVPSLDSQRIQALRAAGIGSVEDLATATPEAVARALGGVLTDAGALYVAAAAHYLSTRRDAPE